MPIFLCYFLLRSVSAERQQGYIACTLDRCGQHPLMLSAAAGDAAGNDLTALADIFVQLSCILVIDFCSFVYTEAAYFPSRPSASFTSHHIA